jgi:hypothetical protein
MTTRALTVHDIGRELGRTAEWVSRHWRGLVRSGKLPPPLIEAGGPTWDAAQVYAVRDKPLTPPQRAVAAAFRAALDAAHASPVDRLYDDELARDRARLDRRFDARDRMTEAAANAIVAAQKERP